MAATRLLAGNRAAGHETVDLHLDHPQMEDWLAFDEGGRSGSGGWQHLRTTWAHSKTEPDKNHAVAMPHGWAIAEVWLLIRDCLVHEVGGFVICLPPDLNAQANCDGKPVEVKENGYCVVPANAKRMEWIFLERP